MLLKMHCNSYMPLFKVLNIGKNRLNIAKKYKLYFEPNTASILMNFVNLYKISEEQYVLIHPDISLKRSSLIISFFTISIPAMNICIWVEKPNSWLAC